MEHRDGIRVGDKAILMWYQCKLRRRRRGRGKRGYRVDKRSRHCECVSGTYGRGKRGMKWDTRH